jgi:hypothetical protein
MNQLQQPDPKEERIFELIPLLVQLGRTEDPSVIPPSKLPDSWDFGVLWKRWDRVVKGWEAKEVADLIKGLTYFEKVFNCGFGSIPPVPQLFGIYASMVDSSERDNFADWILVHTVNNYVPYGTNNFGLRSLAALSMKKAALADRRRTNAESEQVRYEEAQRNKGQLATERLPKALRRKDAAAVAALLAKGADVNAPLESGQNARDIAKELGIESWIDVESAKAER